MAKKVLSLMLLMVSVTGFAATQSSQPIKKKKRTQSNYELNKPTVGSRQQSSDQQFGTPQITGTKGTRGSDGVTEGKGNNPLVGSRQQSSDQQFGTPQITGTKGVRGSDGVTEGKGNNPLVGSRQQSSDQQFGTPQINGTSRVNQGNTGSAPQNPATVGGRQSGSDQIFGNPGDPTNQ